MGINGSKMGEEVFAMGSEKEAMRQVARIYAVNDRFFQAAMDGLTDEELWQHPEGGGNPILWIAGHVVECRAAVVRTLGGEAQTGWNGLFGRGAKVGDAAAYPSGAEMREAAARVAPKLQKVLAEASDAVLESAAQMRIPGQATVADEVAFLAWHDSYHLGQMSYARKALGHSSLMG